MNTLSPALNRLPAQFTHIHLMGICGTGMAALAGMLQAKGYRITGSDGQVYPPMSHFLEKLGIAVSSGYAPENLEPRPDLVIVGNVITRINPEAQALAALAIPYLSFPQALALFFIAGKSSLVITGTHGKTTTCALLASALDQAGLEPSFMIGGIVDRFASNFRLGRGAHFVVEGDEYDSAFFDKESKFLHYRPDVAVITSIEFDHADIFADLAAIKAAFAKFVQLMPADGLLIANLDDPAVREVVASAPCPVEGYGLSPSSTWSLGDIAVSGGRSRFTVHRDGKPWSTMTVAMSGRHNCLNSLAVTAVLARLGLTAEQIGDGLSSFSGVKRRQEVRGVVGGVTVIDDFAHHPTAVRETLTALRAAYPGQRLLAVFEPRTNSSRRAIFQQDYIEAFTAADLVLLREPLPIADLAAEQLFSSRRLAEDLHRQNGQNAQAFAGTDTMLERLVDTVRPGDVVAVLSNGGFDDIHARLLSRLAPSDAAAAEARAVSGAG